MGMAACFFEERWKAVGLFYFARFCHLATFFRYLTLYFEADGLTAADIGLLWSVHRFLYYCLTPFWGAVADRTKKARNMLQVSLVIRLLPFLALAIPVLGTAKIFARATALWAYAILSGPWGGIPDGLARAACNQDAGDWGRARVWGAVGWALTHLALGPLMDSLGPVVLFVSNAATTVFLYLVVRNVMPQSCGTVEAEVTPQAVRGIFWRNWAFFVNTAMVGGGFSMVEGMLFLLLQELKASTLLCGLSVVVTVIFELPIFHYAKPLLARLGAKRMLLLGQAAWVVRALYYSRMTNPWSVLFIEPLHGVTFALVWTAALHHVAQPEIVGPGLEASGQGILSFCFHGVGQAVGLSLGGFLFYYVGSHAVYAIFAVVVGSSGLVYASLESSDAAGPSHTEPSSTSKAPPQPLPLGRTDTDESVFGQDSPQNTRCIDGEASPQSSPMATAEHDAAHLESPSGATPHSQA